MPCSRSASIARGRVDLSRRAGGQAPSRRRRGHDAGQPAAARGGSGRQDQSLHVPARSAAERRGALCQPADRGGDRRDAGSGDRRRGAAVAALRGAAGPRRSRWRRKLSCRPPSASAIRREMRRGDVEAGLAAASKRIDATYETPTQYHNAMEPHAIVAAWDGDTLSIDTPSQGLAMAQGRHRRTVRHRAGEDPYSQPLPRRRLRLEGPDLRTANARHPGGAAGRPAGQARAAP